MKKSPSFIEKVYAGMTDIAWIDNTSDFVWDIYRRVRNFIASVRMFFFWGWRLRNNYDWDYGYLMDFIKIKLKRMDKALHAKNKEYELSYDQFKSQQALRLAILLLERFEDRGSETGYAINACKSHNLKWGSLETNMLETEAGTDIRFWRKNAKTEAEKEQEAEEYRKLMNLDHEIYKRDVKIFWNIMQKYHTTWWD